MSMRHSVASKPVEAVRRVFADDVAYYLSLTPRQLPSRYLYDDLGSALFSSICRLPWYEIARTELRLLREHGPDIFRRVKPLSTLVELGPGGGEKLTALLAVHPPSDLTLHLIDVSREALDMATSAIGSAVAGLVVAHQATYEEGLSEIRRSMRANGRILMLFLGSNLGNFDPPDASAFLRTLRGSMVAGDALLLGTDLVKPEGELLLAYDDPLGVTAAFNRNLLVRVNRELGADFDVTRFAHRAVWNASASRVEMHLVSDRQQHVHVPASNLDVTFDAGEMVWTESSYKYLAEDVPEMLHPAGFVVCDQWVASGFALTLAEAI